MFIWEIVENCFNGVHNLEYSFNHFCGGSGFHKKTENVQIVVSDRPGGISELANIVSTEGASIKDMFLVWKYFT